MQCLYFFTENGFKLIDPKEFDLNKYTSNSSKGYVREGGLEYQEKKKKEKEKELHNNYPSTPNKIQIKREMLSENQLRIADSYNIPIGNVSMIKKCLCLIMKT